jgi:tRNA U34 5-carboxymethylaminomethyl modifying GTPase MnmE/TrmE
MEGLQMGFKEKFPNVTKVFEALSTIGDHLSKKDISDKKTLELYNYTLLNDSPNMYGPFMKQVELNRDAPKRAEAERLRQEEINKLKIKLEEELEHQKRITQQMVNNTPNTAINTSTNALQKIEELQRQIDSLQAQPSTLQNFNTPNNLNSVTDTKKTDDFFNQMYGKK